MNVTGIIAECNPMHDGHAYLFRKAGSLTSADYIIAVISGNYVQRGAPAVFDKSVRTKALLQNGADLVIELPLYYAASAADYFARGGITLLDKLHVVNNICFGSESGDTQSILETGKLIAEESEDFKTSIRLFLKQGMTYPQARAAAVSEVYPGRNVLSTPNDLLASEYCKYLVQLNSSIKPCAVKRISTDGATALRAKLENTDTADTESLPEIVRSQLCGLPEASQRIFADDFSLPLLYALHGKTPDELAEYLDVSHDLAARIVKMLPGYRDFSSFCLALKSRNYTYTGCSRALLHILLQMKDSNMQKYCGEGTVGYARILGFRKDASPLLHELGKRSEIPLLTKLSGFEKQLEEPFASMLREEIRCSELYAHIAAGKSLQSGHPIDKVRSEYERQIVIV